MSDFTPMTMEQIQAEAQKFKCEVIVAAQDELQFDLDSPEAEKRFDNFLMRMATGVYKGLRVSTWASKSGNRHFSVKHPAFASMSMESRIALQTMGGSDEGREYAALHCFWAGSPHPVLLFKPLAALDEQRLP